MNEISFVDVTFRDGNASLWAERMTTGMMLPVAEQMDQVGFSSMEFIAPSHFKKCVRELREDPWERIRLISKKIKKTPLSILMHCSITAFDVTPLSILKLWIERLAVNGINRVQLLEPSNDMSFRIPETVQFVKDAGLKVAIPLVYSFSPKHTDDYYAQKAREAAELKVDAIFLQDPSGLLTPERTKTLIPAILQNIGKTPFEVHFHCNTGLAPLCYLEAIKLGVKTLHTAIPPLANSSSLPSVLNIARNAYLLGYTPILNEEIVKQISNHFSFIAKKEKLPMGTPVEFDYYQYITQVPGGVISNLRHQLSQLKMENRLDDVLEEIAQVRKDLGYPIMVTPFSQFVVSQATINVMLGERYKEVTDEVIQYALGFWGKEASSSIDLNVLDKIMGRPRAKELLNWERPEPSIRELRERIGGPGISDDELLLCLAAGGEDEVKAMRAANPIKEYLSAKNPLITLIQELKEKKGFKYINIQKGDFKLTLKGSCESKVLADQATLSA
jgi:oxaloacetate decarboxylase alpha subunit